MTVQFPTTAENDNTKINNGVVDFCKLIQSIKHLETSALLGAQGNYCEPYRTYGEQ